MPLLVAPLVSSAAPLATGHQHALVPGWGGVDNRFGWQLREALLEGWPRRARAGPCDESELSNVTSASDAAVCIARAAREADVAAALRAAEDLLLRAPLQLARFNRIRRTVLPFAYDYIDAVGRKAAGSHAAEIAVAQHALDELLHSLAIAFRALHNGHRPLLFLHVSKSGGTSLCRAASQNLPNGTWPDRPAGGNCVDYMIDADWTQAGDGPLWTDPPNRAVEVSCSERRRRFGRLSLRRARRVAFMERYLDHGGQLCDDVLYGVMLRDPVERVVAHVNELWRQEPVPRTGGVVHTTSMFRRLLSHDVPGDDAGSDSGDSEESRDEAANAVSALVQCSAEHAHSAVFDAERIGEHDRAWVANMSAWRQLCGITSNYNVRSLRGVRRGDDVLDGHPFQPVTLQADASAQRQLAREGLQVLMQMSLVLLTDELGSPSTATLLRAVLGWKNVSAFPHERDAHATSEAADVAEEQDEQAAAVGEQAGNSTDGPLPLSERSLPAAEREQLVRFNAADATLLEWARTMTWYDVRFLREAGLDR